MDDSTGRVKRPRKAQTTSDDQTDQRVLEIREEIVETRNDMSETIDAIQERLSPAHLAAQAKDTVRNAATEKVQQMANSAGDAMEQVFGRSFVDTIRENPIPAAMVGIGAAWLIRNSRAAHQGYGYDGGYGRGGGYRVGSRQWDVDRAYGDRYGVVGTRGTIGAAERESIGDQARDTFDNLSDRAQSAAADVSDATRRVAYRARLQTRDVLQNNPLALGAAALLIGAVVGMSVPETEMENHLMGEARDSVVDRARNLASTATERVSDAASGLVGTALRGGSPSDAPSGSSGGETAGQSQPQAKPTF